MNVDELFKTIDTVKRQPTVATFKFQAGNQWLGGGHNRTTVRNFYGAGQEHARRQPFLLDADEPPVLLGEDNANPVEYLYSNRKNRQGDQNLNQAEAGLRFVSLS